MFSISQNVGGWWAEQTTKMCWPKIMQFRIKTTKKQKHKIASGKIRALFFRLWKGGTHEAKRKNHSSSERKDAGELLLKAVHSEKYVGQQIGSCRGFGIVPIEKGFGDSFSVYLKGANHYRVDLSQDAVGSIQGIENAMKGLEKSLDDKQRYLANLEQQMESAKEQSKRPFENENELKEVLGELTKINASLDMDKSAGDDLVLAEKDGNEDGLGIEEADEYEDDEEAEV